MNKERILLIGTYPIYPAMHGGQKRTEAIINKYRSLGHEVEYVSICTPSNYPRYGRNDIRVSDEIVQKTHQASSLTFTELVVCQAAASDESVLSRLRAVIGRFKPTLVEYEQGYGYLTTKDNEASLGLSGLPFIYSSHNVEWQMKQNIALGEASDPKKVQVDVQALKDLEQELLERAARVIVVSQADKESFGEMLSRGYVVAPNGINPPSQGHADTDRWIKLRKKLELETVIAFIASAHPPNYTGFRTLLDGVGFLPFNSRIVVAGSLGEMIKQKIKGTKDIQEAVIKNRVYLAGRVSEDSLQGLLKDCDVILLPITEGGGSNLKTAEAIIADKPIVATTHAFRSYEKFIDELPNIYIADTPEAFQQSILAAVKNKPIVRSQEQKAVAESVLWVSVLEGLADISGGSDG